MIPPVDLSLHAKTADNAWVSSRGIQFGALVIDTHRAQCWDPKPPWSVLREKVGFFQEGFRTVVETLSACAPPESLAGLVLPIPRTHSSVGITLLSLAREPANQLISGLRTDDLDLCIQGASGLAGLGMGLTPDGDDWILGTLLATWISKSEQVAIRLAKAIAGIATPRTTPISAAWIRAASRGECAEPWHSFFDCMLRDRQEDLQDTSRRLIHHGHTSGASALAGFLALFCMNAESATLYVCDAWGN
jgi:hypothetical protein